MELFLKKLKLIWWSHLIKGNQTKLIFEVLSLQVPLNAFSKIFEKVINLCLLELLQQTNLP